MKNQIVCGIFTALFLLSVGIVSATPSPGVSSHQPGSPFVSCGTGNAVIEPHGFLTAGFAHAGTVYAGSPGTPSLLNGNPRAVSQYDVACFELTQH